MALQTIPGQGLIIPDITTMPLQYPSTMLVDATGEKVAMIGRVFFKDRTSTKAITKVSFRFSTVVKAGGSNLTLSLQDVSTTTGPVMVPDEVQDQTETIANADANFASNTWHPGAALSANRTVAYGEKMAVVLEFDAGGRLGTDSFIVAVTQPHFSNTDIANSCLLKSGAGPAWAGSNFLPNVIFEFTDGTFGTFDGAAPTSAISNQQFKQDTAGSDEYAMEFSLPFPCKVDGGWVATTPITNAADFSIVLYDGTTAMTNGTVAIDANQVLSVNTNSFMRFRFPDMITLAANTTYRLAIQPTQITANVRMMYFDVDTANHMQALPGGTSFALTSRLDLGSWNAPTATRRPLMAISVCALDDAVGGGTTNIFNHME